MNIYQFIFIIFFIYIVYNIKNQKNIINNCSTKDYTYKPICNTKDAESIRKLYEEYPQIYN